MSAETKALVLDMPLFSDPDVLVEIFDVITGEHYDSAYNLETAETYVNSGNYIGVAVNSLYWHDGELRNTVEELQHRMNIERELVEDCFGLRRVTLSFK